MKTLGPSDSLSHYGVKGMRWGKRKDDTSNPKSSKELVKAAADHRRKIMKPSQDIRIERMFSEVPVKYSELSSKDVTINKGKELVRITKRKNEKLTDLTYASHTKADIDRYRSVMSAMGGFSMAKAKYSPTYEATYKATKKLTSPSEKARVDAFVELLDTKSISVGRKGTMITGREYLKRTGVAMASEVKRLETQELGLKYYNSMTENQFRKTPLNTAYFNSIRTKGYNMVVDDNDRRVLSDEPIIILDTKGAIKQINVRQLTNDEINNAMKSLVPVKNQLSR